MSQTQKGNNFDTHVKTLHGLTMFLFNYIQIYVKVVRISRILTFVIGQLINVQSSSWFILTTGPCKYFLFNTRADHHVTVKLYIMLMYRDYI